MSSRARLAWQRGALARATDGVGCRPLAVGAPVLLDAGPGVGRAVPRLVDALVESGVVLDRATLYWWVVRPSAAQPTLEIRIGDVAATVDQAVGEHPTVPMSF
jgi:hypothetical protein